MDNLKKEFIPIIKEDYIPNVVKRLIGKMDFNKFKDIALYGFSDNMKWLYRILKENNKDPILCDWRKDFIDYDCGGKKLISISEVKNSSSTLVVVCPQDINLIKQSINYIIENELNNFNCLFDNDLPNNPFSYERPYNEIAEKAIKRAKSMISNEQLFDLIQFVEQTADVDGEIVEYGSLHGGSGAIICEAVNHFAKNKKVWLFDSFKGIPKSKYGLDYHWGGSFSNNSFKEVVNAFKDLKNVKVVNGDINKTYNIVKSKISFGYIASDTFESGKLLLNFIWPKLTKGGIIAVCDYGSFPNCYPLSVIVDKFFENKKDKVFIYRPERSGIFIMKK